MRGRGVPVLDGDAVQLAIVDHHAQGTILLLDEQHWRGERALAGADEPLGGKVGQLFLELGVLGESKADCWA